MHRIEKIPCTQHWRRAFRTSSTAARCGLFGAKGRDPCTYVLLSCLRHCDFRDSFPFLVRFAAGQTQRISSVWSQNQQCTVTMCLLALGEIAVPVACMAHLEDGPWLFKPLDIKSSFDSIDRQSFVDILSTISTKTVISLQWHTEEFAHALVCPYCSLFAYVSTPNFCVIMLLLARIIKLSLRQG